MTKNKHTEYMSRALKLAKKAEGMTSPNPVVGAVVVKNGEIIGKGYHKKAGLPHAEIEAFSDAEKKNKNLKNSTLYVTLEPCCHEDKKTPPCVKSIIEKGISEVHVSTLDPNPKVSGRGVKQLRKSGVKVSVGLLEEKARKINESFIKFISTGTPFVVLKMAVTMDGKIASWTGDSKWIGSETQRKYAHKLRNTLDAVMVGIGTVLSDDPRLNVRLKGRNVKQPIPIILDSNLNTPPDSSMFSVHDRVIIATGMKADTKNKKSLEDNGAQILRIKKIRGGLIDLNTLMKKLGKFGITSLLIEGGSTVAAQALRARIVDKITFFYAPRILGGDGISMIGDMGIKSVKDSIDLRDVKSKRIGNEIMVEGYVSYK